MNLYEVKHKIFNTDYPIVFIPGTFAYNNYELLTGIFNYFNTPNPNIGGIPTRTIYLDTGKFSSPYDNATMCFFQLKGGLADFGEEHSKKHKHNRYERTYPAAYNSWNSTNKIWIVAHSAGAQTALLLQKMLNDNHFGTKTQYKYAADPHNPNNRTNADWIAGMIFTNGMFCGTTLLPIANPIPYYDSSIGDYVVRLKPWHLGYWVLLAIILVYVSPFNSFIKTLINLKMDYYNFEQYSWKQILTMDIDYLRGNDHISFSSSIIGAEQLNRDLKLYPSTFYLSFVGDMTKKIMGVSLPVVISLSFPLYITSLYMCLMGDRYLPEYEESNNLWLQNDGIIPVLSAFAPRQNGKISVKHRLFYQNTIPLSIPYQYHQLKTGEMNIYYPPINGYDHLIVMFQNLYAEVAQRYWKILYASIAGNDYDMSSKYKKRFRKYPNKFPKEDIIDANVTIY